jgi:pilus assembly protein CpaE
VHRGRLLAVVNSKGGAGASFVTANIGHILREVEGKSVALLDLDLVFSPLPDYYDVTPKHSLADALTLSADEIDATALSAYVTRHKSGVDLIGSAPGQLPVTWATPTDRLNHIVELLLSTYDFLIVDTPRQIEPQIQQVLERADILLLVLQQSLMHLRDAKLLKRILTQDFDVAEEKIRTVINRFDRKSAITANHIEKGLGIGDAWQIPNDYGLASQSIEAGALVQELSPRANVTRALRAIASDLVGKNGKARRSVFGRLFARHGIQNRSGLENAQRQ